ncbi:MAG: type II secretion system protein [Candidatus Liptonbacteria bacterium]|nr:type II secretion system protein [Candidatus Liptonbacteria bacterium]
MKKLFAFRFSLFVPYKFLRDSTGQTSRGDHLPASPGKPLLAPRSSLLARRGYTLVEMIISVGIFAVIVSVAVGGFVRSLRSQRQASALLAANSTMSLVLEQMAREIRVGKDFCTGAVSACSGNPTDYLSFHNGQGAEVTYCPATEPDGTHTIRRGLGVSGALCSTDSRFQKITPDSINIRSLSFLLQGNSVGDLRQPLITISVGVSPKELGVDVSELNIETSVSSRVPDS